MPLFVLICRDRPGQAQTRVQNRAAHLEWLQAKDNVRMAGPLIAEGEMRGSLVVIEADSLEQAQAWAAGDPYKAADLFDSVEIIEWKQVI